MFHRIHFCLMVLISILMLFVSCYGEKGKAFQKVISLSSDVIYTMIPFIQILIKHKNIKLTFHILLAVNGWHIWHWCTKLTYRCNQFSRNQKYFLSLKVFPSISDWFHCVLYHYVIFIVGKTIIPDDYTPGQYVLSDLW